MRDPPRHTPVLPTIVLEILVPQPGHTVLDVTLGLGGHALLFLERIQPGGRLIGVDADAENLALARERLREQGNVDLRHGNFRDIAAWELPPVDVLFADLGLSSPHVDDPERGFSFREEGPLDLRFDRTRGESAVAFLARATERDLIEVLRLYGELPGAHRLAHAILKEPPATTGALRQRIEGAVGYRAPAILPRVFQALRIAVNDELRSLAALLDAGSSLLAPGGRMAIISYHSLEDRLVKHAFRSLTTPARDPVTGKIAQAAPFDLLTRHAITPDPAEIAVNPRSRSAKFRAIRRLLPTPTSS